MNDIRGGRSGRIVQRLNEHYLFFIVLAIVICSRIPFVANLHAVILLNQDFNPEHFGRLFLDNDIPAADDSEAGENASTFSLVSIYYWLPLLFYRIGVPFEAFAGLHAMLVLPLIAIGIYRLALSLFEIPRIACLAVLIFLFKDFALFRLNLGYPLLLNSTIYQSDTAYIFVIFALGAMASGRVISTAVWIAGLALLNPTSLVTLTTCFAFYLLFSGRLRRADRWTIASIVMIGLGALVAFAFVSAATPIRDPAPVAARALAIIGNAHLNPHISMPLVFIVAQIVIAAGLIYSVFVERMLKQGETNVKQRADARCLSYAVLGAYVLLGWIGYWILFVTVPEWQLIIAPAKIFMVAAIFLSAYAAFALHSAWVRFPVFVVCVLALAVYFIDLSRLARMQSWSGAALVLMCVILAAIPVGFLARGKLGKDALMLRTFWLHALIAVFLCDFGERATRVFRSGELDVAQAFYEIQMQIKARIPIDSIFVPYRYRGTVTNQYGPFRNWPFRTYSRRGGFVFWSFGRTMYFNTNLRHNLEATHYAAFGINLWDEVLREADAARRENPFFYYTGVRFDGGMPRMEATPIWTILSAPYDELKDRLLRMSLDEFKQRAAAMGASHVIVSLDPGKGREPGAIVENGYFSVVEVE